MWKCDKCGRENPDQYRYCTGCGNERPRSVKPKAADTIPSVWKCRFCGTENTDEQDFCSKCGISRPQVSRTADSEERVKSLRKRKHIGILVTILALFVLGSIVLTIYKPIPTPPQSSARPSVTVSPQVAPEPAPTAAPAPTPDPPSASMPAETATPASAELPVSEAEPFGASEDSQEGSTVEAGNEQTAAVSADRDQELSFTYSGGEKSLLLSFDPQTHEVLTVRSLHEGICEFRYEFSYLPDGRLATITRFDGKDSPVLTREYAYTDDLLSVQRKIVPGKNDVFTALDLKKNYVDAVAANGHTIDRTIWPTTDLDTKGYTLCIWSDSIETGAAKPADREVFRIRFSPQGHAESYTYCWRNEIAAFPEYEQFAEETHMRDDSGNWYRFATLLTLKDKSGKQAGVYQRLLDDTEWKEYQIR